MKKILFATTAAGAIAVAGMASAQGVTVFGDARLGLGYNITNSGGVLLDDDGNTDDDVRAISRVRFGVRMTGETPTGITFGATIRADNALGGQGGAEGQAAGNVFASGALGTLTYGDTSSAHQQHTGDLPDVGLTGLGFFNELAFLGNRRHNVGIIREDRDGIERIIGMRSVRPIVRYDYDFAGFSVSASTDRDLLDIGVGASFTGDFGIGSFTVGGGYYDDDENEQYSASIAGTFAGFGGNVVYLRERGDAGDETLGAGLTTTVADFGVNAFYNRALRDGDIFDDGDDAFGVGLSYDLGGGASIRTGVVRTYGSHTVADFGIAMSF